MKLPFGPALEAALAGAVCGFYHYRGSTNLEALYATAFAGSVQIDGMNRTT